MNKKEQTYDFICFSDLVYESYEGLRKKTEAKIRRRLRYYCVGKYRQEKIDRIRTLRNTLYVDITAQNPLFYTNSGSKFSELHDFDIDKMQEFYISNYPDIHPDELRAMILFAIYSFHLL